MRIILAHNNYHLIGGAEVFYHEVGRVLEKNGHEVAYFSPADTNIESKWFDYFPKSADYKNSSTLQGVLSVKQMIYSNSSKEKMAQLIEDFNPDIVHVFAIYVRLTPSILDACRDKGVPVVMSCNDYKHICPNYKLFQNGGLCEQCKGGKFYNAIKNKCSKNSLKYSVASALEAYSHDFLNIYKKNIHTFLFASEFMARKTEEFWGQGNFKWDILKNPFESKKFLVSNNRENYILYFGRLIDEKGVDVLVHAMKHCPDVNLKIIGEGPDEIYLKELATKIGLSNIEFLGAKWNEELNNILSKAKFVVIPSVWHENFPYVILQSFALGKAVIGTNRGGIPELINNEKYGLIYEAHDSIELGNKINYLWNNDDLAISMGISAKEYMDANFNDNAFYNNVLSIYKNVLSESINNRR